MKIWASAVVSCLLATMGQTVLARNGPDLPAGVETQPIISSDFSGEYILIARCVKNDFKYVAQEVNTELIELTEHETSSQINWHDDRSNVRAAIVFSMINERSFQLDAYAASDFTSSERTSLNVVLRSCTKFATPQDLEEFR